MDKRTITGPEELQTTLQRLAAKNRDTCLQEFFDRYQLEDDTQRVLLLCGAALVLQPGFDWKTYDWETLGVGKDAAPAAGGEVNWHPTPDMRCPCCGYDLYENAWRDADWCPLPRYPARGPG